MKQKVRQRKKNKKTHMLFRVIHKLQGPYRIFIDDSALEACAHLGLTNPKQHLVDLFALIGYKSSITLCTHTRVLDKLRAEGKTDALQIGQKLLYVSIKSGTLGKHERSENDPIADVCSMWIEANTKAQPDHRCCLIATNSDAVKGKLKAFPHVPTLRVDEKLKTFALDDAIVKMKQQETHAIKREKALERSKKRMRGVNPLSNKPKRKKISLDQAYAL